MEIVEVPVSPVRLPSLHDSCLAVATFDTELEETVLGAALRYYGEVGDGDVE